MSTTTELDTPLAFELKGSLFTFTVLRLLKTDLSAFRQQLDATVAKAPKFFHHTPIVVDLSKVSSSDEPIDFTALLDELRAHSLIPMGVSKGNALQHAAALEAGLPQLPEGKETSPKSNPTKTPTSEERESYHTPSQNLPSKLITQPVRSGQQIYAKDADLIVLSSVSNGAELLADGHIHVYGTLRGRALAGVNGNTEARIFCQSLEAELVSIAGYYLLHEDANPLLCKSAHIFLNGESLVVESLDG